MRRKQRELVLELLDDGGWHSTIEFVEVGILRVASRVFDLRCEGYSIEARHRPGRSTIYEYRLLEAGAVVLPASPPLAVCPTCRTPKRVTTVRAGLAYLSCGLHFVPVDELGEGVA